MAGTKNGNYKKCPSVNFVKFMLFVQGFRLSFGQSEDLPYVAVVRSPVATTESSTIIGVYNTDGRVEFHKAMLINVNRDNQRLRFLNDPPLPDGSVIDTTNEPATLMLPATLSPTERTGIYTISVERGSQTVRWRVLVTNEHATIRAVEYSTVASVGDDVTVSVEDDPLSDLRWRRDGTNVGICDNSLSCEVGSATGSYDVFECYRHNLYVNQEHAIMIVYVRECASNKWGPPGCINDCQPCINGGICSDLTGRCLCPPGFSGNHCENVHGRNVFGQNAEYKCDNSGDDHSPGCQGAMICYPRPFGCICPAGYTGLDCMQTCGEGTFGANCKQECHCMDNSMCASDTGVCENGECESGYKGTNCQLVVCAAGVYGDFCDIPCSCDSGDCDDVEANCVDGCAVPWTGSACNQDTGDGVIQLSYIEVNTGQVTAVRCSIIRNPLVAEDDLILSPAGTPCTGCSDNQNSDRSYNQTKTVMITLRTPIEMTCIVRNTNKMETIMLVPYVLPAYTMSDVLTFSSVSSTSIRVDWPGWNQINDIGDGPVVDYRIQMRESGTEGFSPISKGTDLVHQFNGLKPDTVYEFSIILVREGLGGEGAPSNVQVQRTLCDVFPSVTDLSVTAEEPGQLEVTWNRPDSNCVITSYTVNYHLLNYLACDSTPSEEETDTVTVVMSTSYSIQNLNNYANYSVTVRTNEDGEQEMMSAITSQSTPSEPPMNIQLVRSTPTELEFSWDPPRCQSQNGVITNYSYQLQSQDNRTVEDGITESQEIVLVDLVRHNVYSFVVSASTSEGSGPPSGVIVARTEEDTPGPPRNVNVSDRSETSLTIEWSMPENPNGNIIHYQVEFRAIEKLYDRRFVLGEFDQNIEVSNQGENNIYVLTGLEPSTLYEIKLSAFTIIGQGDFVSIEGRTDLFTDLKALPILPEIDFRGTTATLTLPALEQQYASAYYIRVQINSADKQRRDVDGFGSFNQNSDHYIAAEVEKNEQEMEFTLGDREVYGGYLNAPLQEETNYNAYIGIGSKVGEDVSVSWSDPIPFGPNPAAGMPPNFPVVIVAVVVVVVILTVLILGGFVYCRRSPSKTVNEDDEFGPAVANPTYDNVSSSTEEKHTETNVYEETTSQPPVSSPQVIKISNLTSYVREKKGNSEDNFVTEFETLPTDQLYPWTVAEKPENKTKNRYGNIIPYDNSRVVLEVINGDPHSDYINASYIDGYMSPKKFIASHGPNTASVIDFWRMVWQDDVARIVMLTPLVEDGKKKCLKYWPDEDFVYGELLVRCTKLEKHSKYSQRTFHVSLKHGDGLKTVEHFHFTDWKDMKVPEFLDPTLDFLRIVRKDYSERGRCTIVHCSAGVGRTGTYITLDAMLDMGQAEQQINVYEFVKQMRHRRIQSVQVQEQYEFIFDTLVKYFHIGRTMMSVESFRSELGNLKQVNSATGNTFIMDQFQKLKETTRAATPSDVREGAKKENKVKNRSSEVLPVGTHRPILMTAGENDGSNYINATFLGGYKQKDFFIATQMPLKNTIVDFWRLVWDYNCSVIVMLNSLENKNEQYWPESSPVTFSPFTVVPLSSEYQGNICVRKMEVGNTTLQDKRTIHQIQCIDWPNHEIMATRSSEVLIHCTHLLKKFCSESAVDHVLVHCIDGVGRTGVFCGLVAALDQARTEQEVDIFQLVSNMRKAQPLMIQNLEQYQCIFDSVLSDLESDGNTYQNV